MTFELSAKVPANVVSHPTLFYVHPLQKPDCLNQCSLFGGNLKGGWKQPKEKGSYHVWHLPFHPSGSCFRYLSHLDDRVHAYQSSPVPLIRVDATKPHPKSGLVQLEWNLDGTLLMARFGIDTTPSCCPLSGSNLGFVLCRRASTNRNSHLLFPQTGRRTFCTAT